MKNLLKRVALESALELPVRKLYSAISAKLSGAVDRNLAYDIQTLEVMKRVLLKDSNCVDVGCHEGAVLRSMMRMAPRGTHFAFEPIPEMHQRLVQTLGGNQRIRLYRCALSDNAGTASFHHVLSNPGYSGLRPRKYDHPDERIEEIFVETDLLDDVLPSGVTIDFLKVDVEGAELQVFRGATDTIKRNKPVIVFEHGLGAADCYGTTPESVFDLLSADCGLRLFVMAQWLNSNGRASLTIEDFCREFKTGNNYYFMAAP